MRVLAGTYSVTVGNGTAVSNSNSLSFDGQDDEVNKFFRFLLEQAINLTLMADMGLNGSLDHQTGIITHGSYVQ